MGRCVVLVQDTRLAFFTTPAVAHKLALTVKQKLSNNKFGLLVYSLTLWNPFSHLYAADVDLISIFLFFSFWVMQEFSSAWIATLLQHRIGISRFHRK